MYTLGAYIVSKYAGTTLEDFVKQRIFGPLNMTTSLYFESEASIGSRLTQSWTIGNRRIPNWFSGDQVGLMAGPAAAISDAVDMYVFWSLATITSRLLICMSR